jgi:FSR family fosmidomycin resistance protein-like MFS transporter
VRDALRILTRREVFRWLFLLELSDLLLDVLLGFLALYLVDVASASTASAGLAVAVWTGAGLAGSAAVIPFLERVDGLRYLRASAVLVVPLFAGFLVVPGLPAKLALVAAMALVNAADTRCCRLGSTGRSARRAASPSRSARSSPSTRSSRSRSRCWRSRSG